MYGHMLVLVNYACGAEEAGMYLTENGRQQEDK